LYGFVPLETGIARDSLFLGLSRRCRESGFRSRKFGSFQREGGITSNLMLSQEGSFVFMDPIRGKKILGHIRDFSFSPILSNKVSLERGMSSHLELERTIRDFSFLPILYV
jgi:hypothetical protein